MIVFPGGALYNVASFVCLWQELTFTWPCLLGTNGLVDSQRDSLACLVRSIDVFHDLG